MSQTDASKARALERKQVLPGVRTPGRGKRKGTGKRDKRVCVRLSAEEHEVLARKARAAGISVSGLLRDHLDRVSIYNHRGQQRWFAVLLSLRTHLAALCEKAAGFSPADAAVAIAYLAAIARHLDRLAARQREYAREILPSRDGQ
jgi:Mobilization protein NikA